MDDPVRSLRACARYHQSATADVPMSSRRQHQAHGAIRPSPWSIHVSFCVVAFIVTAVLVYHWGSEMSRRAAPAARYVADVAINVAPVPDAAIASGSVFGISLHDGLIGDAASAERITIEHGDGLGRDAMRITLAAVDADPKQARAIVDRAADEATARLRHAWKRQAAARRAAADAATEGARREMERLGQRYERAFQQALEDATNQERGPSNGNAATRPSPPTRRAVSPSAETEPARRENPRWSERHRHLVQLEQEHQRMLGQRTPEHPAVVKLATDIGELRRQLAGIPRWLPSPGRSMAQPPKAQPRPEPTPKPAAPKSRPARQVADKPGLLDEEVQKNLEQLRADVKRAEQQYLASLDEKSRAIAGEDDPLQLDVRFGEVTSLGDAPVETSRLWALATAAGLAMAVGLGLFSAGAALEPMLNSVGELQAMMASTPVVAAVPAPVTLPPPARRAPRPWLRAMLCLAGLLLIGGCVALVWWGIFAAEFAVALQ